MKEIKKFTAFTFLASWMIWGLMIVLIKFNILNYPSPLSIILLLLGGNVPAFYEIWLRKQGSSKAEYKAFLKNIINPKHPISWYLFIIIVILVNSIIQSSIPTGIGKIVLKAPLYFAILSLPIMIIGGGFEEIGWRGFLQPSLEKRFSPLISSLIVGIVWAIWHAPLWFVPGTNQTQINFLSFFINAIGLAFLLAVIYSGTKSIFMCIIFHALFNSFMEIFSWNNSIIANLVVLIFDLIVFFTYQYIDNKSIGISIEKEIKG